MWHPAKVRSINVLNNNNNNNYLSRLQQLVKLPTGQCRMPPAIWRRMVACLTSKSCLHVNQN